MNRRAFLALAGAPVLAAAEAPKTIVIVLCDDLGYGDLGCYGHPVIRTPNLDAFARQGMRFTDGYAAAPVCSPSRCGMLTGRTPTRVGVYDWIPAGSPMHLRAGEVTFAQILRKRGYATCLTGKWHANGVFNDPAQPQPDAHGFEHWFATQNNAIPSHEDPNNFVRNGKPVGPLKGYSSGIIVDEALSWLRGLPAAKPACLFVCFHSPHEPIATSAGYVDLYPKAEKKGEALYYGNVTEMDHHFGRLLDGLKATGREDALVLFTSDNGPETLLRYPNSWRSHGTPGPLRGQKLSLYEGGYRVPVIARWPNRIQPGTTSGEPVCGVDILPTVCDLLGEPLPPGRNIDGASLLPAFSGRAIRRARPLHWHYFNAMHHPRATLRDGDWKLLGSWAPDTEAPRVSGFRPEDGPEFKRRPLVRFELYNLRKDPGEKRDLAASEPRRLARMKAMLLKAHAEVCGEGPDWNAPV